MFRYIYKKILGRLPPHLRVSLQYFRVFKEFPNLDNPQTLNEKILRRIFFEKDPNFAFYADKYAVRKYIVETIGEKYLVPLLAVYNNAKELSELKEWENIVIKPNHGAGMVKIIDHELSLDGKKEIIRNAEQWLDFDFGRYTGEWHYSRIKPKLLVEEKITALGESLRDYKFHRFTQQDGSFKQILQIIAERSEDGFETSFFDLNDLDTIIHSPFGYEVKLSDYEKDKIKAIEKLNMMICTEIDYVRLDWYITSKSIYFGEITLTPGAGLSPNFDGDFGLKLGQLWSGV